MADQPSSLSRRAEARAEVKARRAKRNDRREAFFDLVAPVIGAGGSRPR